MSDWNQMFARVWSMILLCAGVAVWISIPFFALWVFRHGEWFSRLEIWSKVAAPLAIATAVLTRGTRGAPSRRELYWLGGGWIALLGIAYLLQNDPWHWFLRLALVPPGSPSVMLLDLLEVFVSCSELVFSLIISLMMVSYVWQAWRHDNRIPKHDAA